MPCSHACKHVVAGTKKLGVQEAKKRPV